MKKLSMEWDGQLFQQDLPYQESIRIESYPLGEPGTINPHHLESEIERRVKETKGSFEVNAYTLSSDNPHFNFRVLQLFHLRKPYNENLIRPTSGKENFFGDLLSILGSREKQDLVAIYTPCDSCPRPHDKHCCKVKEYGLLLDFNNTHMIPLGYPFLMDCHDVPWDIEGGADSEKIKEKIKEMEGYKRIKDYVNAYCASYFRTEIGLGAAVQLYQIRP
ncbi:MAG: hypothetical protein WCV90_02780 [Candidatus Woesearchaeota archaeon]